jgi:hypothetical protein
MTIVIACIPPASSTNLVFLLSFILSFASFLVPCKLSLVTPLFRDPPRLFGLRGSLLGFLASAVVLLGYSASVVLLHNAPHTCDSSLVLLPGYSSFFTPPWLLLLRGYLALVLFLGCCSASVLLTTKPSASVLCLASPHEPFLSQVSFSMLIVSVNTHSTSCTLLTQLLPPSPAD